MEINLSDETKQLIDRWIAAGVFRSPEEVIQAGVEHLGPVDERGTTASLREKILEGMRDIEAGRCREIDIESFIRECERNHTETSGS